MDDDAGPQPQIACSNFGTFFFVLFIHVLNLPESTQDIFEALSNIPVHIGAVDLKWVLYHALLPQYIKWSKGFPLQLEDCQIRNKLWVELVPKIPDVDAVADYFFISKGKNKTKAFTPKQGVDLYLVITNEKYEAILQHISDIEEVSPSPT